MTPAEMTLLDKAHARLAAAPDDRAARLRFHEAVARAELFLLLEAPAAGDSIRPATARIDGQEAVLAFDSEERLTRFAAAPAPFAALAGRDLAAMLAGSELGMALNPGVAPSATVLPPETLAWLARIADEAARQPEASPAASASIAEVLPPAGFPPDLLGALDVRLAAAAGLVARAWLVAARHDDGARTFLLVLPGLPEAAQAPLARSLAEAVAFSADDVTLDVAFPPAGSRLVAACERVGLPLDLPPAPAAPETAPPGSDPDRPPILKPGRS